MAPEPMQILLDAMCGGLRSYLRMCGHDAAYSLDREIEDDDSVLAWAADEDRVLVTRDLTLATRADREAAGAIALSKRAVSDQLRELADAGVDLRLADPPTRCGRCNGRLGRVDPGDPRPEYVPSHEAELWRCDDCDQCFWRGSHWRDVRARLARVRSGGMD